MVITDGRREQMMSDNSMSAKTVVVTGATAGIGLEAAKEFARRGARVMITARDEAKGEKAVAEITSAGEGRVLVEAVACDFSSISSIRAAAAIIKQRTDRIDVLLNNAGAVNMERSKSADGLELTFAVNHIGYFVFTDELLDLIKLSAPSRVVNVASDAHKAARKGVTFDDLERTRGYAGFSVYGETKLMNILYTRELARRIAGSGVTVNCLHPGVIASGFGLNNKGFFGWVVSTFGPWVLLKPAQGAQTSIFLCASPEVEGVTGGYFAKNKIAKTTRFGDDAEAARRLWDISEAIAGKHTTYEPVVGTQPPLAS